MSIVLAYVVPDMLVQYTCLYWGKGIPFCEVCFSVAYYFGVVVCISICTTHGGRRSLSEHILLKEMRERRPQTNMIKSDCIHSVAGLQVVMSCYDRCSLLSMAAAPLSCTVQPLLDLLH